MMGERRRPEDGGLSGLGMVDMSELTVMARQGRWMLVDEDDAELGAYGSKAEALQAAGDHARVAQEPRHVLIQDPLGDWDEALVTPPPLH
jgi:hypothetical protein